MNQENCELKVRGDVTRLVQSTRRSERNLSWFAVHPGGIKTEDGLIEFPLKHIEIQSFLCNFLCASDYHWKVSMRITQGDQYHFGKEIRIERIAMKIPTIFREAPRIFGYNGRRLEADNENDFLRYRRNLDRG